MELSIEERLQLTMLLPSEGNITNIKIVRQLREDLSFSEEEHESIGMVVKHELGRIDWDKEKAFDVDIPVGPQAMKVIVEVLEKLNSEEKLTAELITLYDKFMDTTEKRKFIGKFEKMYHMVAQKPIYHH